MKRASGILMPIFSLPSPYGIGTLGKAAYDWIDFLAKAKQQYWQILPLGPTSYGDSPYQSFSTFAGNPYFIDLDFLVQDRLLKKEECEQFSCETGTNIDYACLYEKRFLLLQKAFMRFEGDEGIKDFRKSQENWIEDYALYMALKQENGQKEWAKWPKELRWREEKALAEAGERLQQSVDFYVFLQYQFFKQWKKLKEYAHQKNVLLIGDMPIYVAMDSADTWANRDIFQMDQDGVPTEVAGCPPDGFSADGQLWGNPLYDWGKLKANGYAWWKRRIKAGFAMTDIVRIDHFRGLESYYAIAYTEKTARNGRWRKGPGFAFVSAIQSEFKDKKIIAEDLGFLTPQVKTLLRRSGYPGMKVLQFAFDAREESDYLPHNYEKNCVVYTGTHDNDTMCGWLKNAARKDVAFARKYLMMRSRKEEQWSFIRAAMASVANLAIVPIQDYLGLGTRARINTPSTLGGNWVWRMQEGAVDDILAERIAEMTGLFGRVAK